MGQEGEGIRRRIGRIRSGRTWGSRTSALWGSWSLSLPTSGAANQKKKAPANLPSWDENEETAEETATTTGFGDAGGDTTTMLTTAVQERIKRGKGGAKKEMTKEERAVHNAQMRRRKRRGSTAHNIIRN
ncbi:hypothetical protein V498_08057 [Pseudogymnoascus sp. VKM F-4517 (FW-2822)]|nr:hypothetical protein V498_08057 [Pseudogymnoascus sp. VKM F-4517 (FW-2822)]